MPLPQACIRAREEWDSCRRTTGVRLGRPRSLHEVVDAYIRKNRPPSRADFAFYANLPSIREAVYWAAFAKRPDGKRADHQRRITKTALRKSAARLKRLSFTRVSSFDRLHKLLEKELGGIEGLGALTVYDTALRLGARLGLEPDYVYLHAGTRAGAQALGLAPAHHVPPTDLPREFRRLSPREIEDCLCIYKAELKRLGRMRRPG